MEKKPAKGGTPPNENKIAKKDKDKAGLTKLKELKELKNLGLTKLGNL